MSIQLVVCPVAFDLLAAPPLAGLFMRRLCAASASWLMDLDLGVGGLLIPFFTLPSLPDSEPRLIGVDDLIVFFCNFT